jgi:hypothetical protein
MNPTHFADRNALEESEREESFRLKKLKQKIRRAQETTGEEEEAFMSVTREIS